MNTFPVEMLDEYMRLQATTNDHQIRAIIFFAGRIDPDKLAQAADLVMDAIPVVRCALVDHEKTRKWESRSFTGHDCVRIAESEADAASLERYLTETAPDSGPQMLLRLLRGQSRDVLIVTINHILADGTGLKDILYALSAAYGTGSCAAFPRNRSLDELLRDIGTARRIRAFFGRPRKTVPTRLLGTGDDSARPRLFGITFNREEFTKMRARGKESGATVNDLVVAAMSSVIADMGAGDDEKSGRPTSVTIQCMVDLRRYASSRAAVGVGNFASMEPLTVTTDKVDSQATLASVIQATRSMKSREPGLRNMLLLGFAHKRLPARVFDNVIAKVIEKVTVSTTNLGEIDERRMRFEDTAIEDVVAVTSLKREPSFQLTVSSFRGKMHLTAFGKYSDGNAASVTDFLYRVERFLRAYPQCGCAETI